MNNKERKLRVDFLNKQITNQHFTARQIVECYHFTYQEVQQMIHDKMIIEEIFFQCMDCDAASTAELGYCIACGSDETIEVGGYYSFR